jgi:hypothetical protein
MTYSITATQSNITREEAAKILEILIRYISEAIYRAGWSRNIEYRVFHCAVLADSAQGLSGGYAFWNDDCKTVAKYCCDLYRRYGFWLLWNDDAMKALEVPCDIWEKYYATWKTGFPLSGPR